MLRTLTLHDKVVTAKGQVAADVGGETIVLNLASGAYVGLNAVASSVWMLLKQPRTGAEVRDALLLEFPDVEAERCASDVLELINDLYQASLVDVVASDGFAPTGAS